MKKKPNLISILIVIAIMISLFSITANAETASASISVSSNKINVGDTIVITANFKASSLASVIATLSYDTSVLKLVSGDSDAAGVVKLLWYDSNSSSTSKKFPLTFRAIKAGVSNIILNADEIISNDEELLGHPSAKINLTVKDVSHNLSSNANLKSLSVSAGALSPVFRPGTTSYTITVPYETTRITMSAIAQDSSAKVGVNNLNNLSVGTNIQIINVIAANGTQKKYTIRIIRKDKINASTPTTVTDINEYPIKINGLQYKIVTDFSKVKSPGSCFSLTTCLVNNEKVPAFKHNNADITVAYLTNQDNQSSFFIYDPENNSYSDFISIQSGENLYVLMHQPNDAFFKNYIKTTVSIKDFKVDTWNIPIGDKHSDFYLVYAVNPSGDTQWYQYDAKEKTLQRYYENVKQVVKDTPSKSTSKYQFTYIIIIAVLFICVVVLVVFQVYNFKKHIANAKHISR